MMVPFSSLGCVASRSIMGISRVPRLDVRSVDAAAAEPQKAAAVPFAVAFPVLLLLLLDAFSVVEVFIICVGKLDRR